MKLACAAIAAGLCAMAAPKTSAAAKLFADRCAACHGTSGAGNTAPSLLAPLRHGASLSAVAKVIRDGVPDTLMPPSGLPEAQNRSLTQYVLSLQKRKPRK